MLNIKAVIFDMDGVLLDSETICDNVWPVAAKEFGVEASSQVLNDCRGMNKADTITYLKNRYGSNFNAKNFLERTSELFHEVEFSTGIPAMPYALETLTYLKEKYILALASSTRGVSVKRQMTNAGMIDFFKTLTTGDMVEHSKPDPEIYLLACKSVNLPPEQCVAVEDSPNGAKSALAAGLKVIIVPDKIQPSQQLKQSVWKVCSTLKDLEDIL